MTKSRTILALAFFSAACASGPKTTETTAPPPLGEEKAFLGVYLQPQGVELNREDAKWAAKLIYVIPDFPANKAGLRRGDLILSINEKRMDGPADKVNEQLTKTIQAQDPHARVRLKILRPKGAKDDLKLLSVQELEAVLQPRKFSWGPLKFPADLKSPLDLNRTDSETGPGKVSRLRQLEDQLVNKYGFQEAQTDLQKKFWGMTEESDWLRPTAIPYLQRNPSDIEDFAQAVEQDTKTCQAETLLRLSGQLIVRPKSTRSKVTTDGPDEGALSQLRNHLNSGRLAWTESFADVREEDFRRILVSRNELAIALASRLLIFTDEDSSRIERNLSSIDAFRKVNLAPLIEHGRRSARLFKKGFFEKLKNELLQSGFALEREVVLDEVTPHGRIMIGGTSSQTYTPDILGSVDLLIDLGGNDSYMNPARAYGLPRPLAYVIDLSGNDTYASSQADALNSAMLGFSWLQDLGGHDKYTTMDGGISFSYAGVSVLVDTSGNDSYKGSAFTQAASFLGVSLLIDLSGNDRYSAALMGQGFSSLGGVSILCDRKGDDHYQAGGVKPSSYGDKDQTDAFSQGSSVGVRYVASGGVSVFLDGSGKDSYDAGTFSQGGAYSYGAGFFFDLGDDSDRYLGSRYGQGFGAHSAIGAFVDGGGDDTYEVRGGAGPGISWDRSIVYFEDRGGSDRRQVSTANMGNAYHNSYGYFFDRAGNDTYANPIEPGGALLNDYHGGSSFSLFQDEGAGDDQYEAFKNNSEFHTGEHSIRLDR